MLASELFDKLKGLVDVKSENLLNMNEEQRIQYAQQWSKDAKSLVETLKNHKGYESLLKDIDRQLKICEEELKQIDEELKKCEDKDRRRKLEKKEERVWKRAS